MTAPTGTKPRAAPDYNLGPVLPHVRRAAEVAGPMFGISTILGWRATARDMLGHPAGLALDYMCELSTGKALNAWLHANAAALGLKYTIHAQTYYPVGGAPEPMEDRGNPTQNHFDHVHAQFRATGGNGAPVDAGVAKSGPMTFDGGAPMSWPAFLGAILPGYQAGEQLGDGSTEGPTGVLGGVAAIGLQIVAVGTAAALVVVGIKSIASNGDNDR